MTPPTQDRKETLRLSHGRSGPLLLCLEPLGEQIMMQPDQTYEIVTVGCSDGHVELIVDDDRVTVYGWNGSDSFVIHEGKRVAGMPTGKSESS
jgi:hypothetical protein